MNGKPWVQYALDNADNFRFVEDNILEWIQKFVDFNLFSFGEAGWIFMPSVVIGWAGWGTVLDNNASLICSGLYDNSRPLVAW